MDVGEKLGKYEIRGTLGRGAMGVVYDGWDPLIQRRVAIKTIRLSLDADDPEAAESLARFRREAQAAGRLQHPNIVGVYDYGETGDLAYLVMEFVDGRSLKAALDAQERFPIPEIARVMRELLDALQYSHEHGVVHRDIKPANVMLTRAGRVKVADFGVARIESSSMTQVGTVIGTPAYMSPEQLAGQTVDSRSDLYSAGVVLYQLLTGDRPYHGSNLTSIYHQALNSDPVPPSKLAVTVPPAFDPVVAHAMAKRPGERYANASEFAAAVDAAANGGATAFPADEPDATVMTRSVKPSPPRQTAPSPPSPATSRPPPTPARRPSRTPVLAAAAVGVLALAGAGGWYFWPTSHTPQSSKGQRTADEDVRRKQDAQRIADEEARRKQDAQQTADQDARRKQDSQRAADEEVRRKQDAQQTADQDARRKQEAQRLADQETQRKQEAQRVTDEEARRKADDARSREQAAVSLTPAALRAAVATAVGQVSCALVNGNVADPGGNVSLVGVAGSGTPVNDLHRAISDAAPAVAVDWRVASFDGPYCRALDVVRPVAAGFGTSGSGFNVALRNGNKPLLEGQLMTIDFSMPNYPAWLLVDYLQHDGTVWHMHPNAKDPARQYTPGARVSLGDPNAGGERWEVGAPYGTDMIIAIASSEPLFTQKRKELEPADAYLAALRAAIETAQRRNQRLAADALVLTTEQKH